MRSFVKHAVYGTVYAVDIDEHAGVIAALAVTDTTACRHRLSNYTLTLEASADVIANPKDYQPFEPRCTDAGHWLADIGDAERMCAEAQALYDSAHTKARAAKEHLESREQALRKLVRDACQPSLPLFEAAGL